MDFISAYVGCNRVDWFHFVTQGKDVESLVHRFKTDLHHCVSFIQDPRKLKESIRELYSQYVQQSDVVSQHFLPNNDTALLAHWPWSPAIDRLLFTQ